MGSWQRRLGLLAVAGIVFAAASCGDDDDNVGGGSAATTGSTGATGATTATTGGATTATTAGGGEPSATTGGGEAPAKGEGITLAVNPWTGSAVNANVAKIVLESKLGTPVELVEIDENATWPGMAKDDIDAVLEVWPSGHAEDHATYVEGEKSVEDLGPLGPQAKIGWYVPSFVVDDHPELATWEGFKDPELAKLFATAETGAKGQFLIGDPSWVSYDDDIITNLQLPLQVVVAGSEAATLTAVQQAEADKKPLLFYFWQPHWLQSRVDLTEVKLPEVTEACKASAKADDGKYDCDYPPDILYKAASVKLKDKNPVAYEFIKKFQLTIDQQNEIAALVDSDGMTPADAAQQWVDENADVVQGWLG